MDYTTGICKLIFKPDHSDIGQWICRFTVTNENADIEIGSATLVLFNNLAGLLIFSNCRLKIFRYSSIIAEKVIFFRQEEDFHLTV